MKPKQEMLRCTVQVTELTKIYQNLHPYEDSIIF